MIIGNPSGTVFAGENRPNAIQIMGPPLSNFISI